MKIETDSTRAVLAVMRGGGQWTAGQVSRATGLGITRTAQILADYTEIGHMQAVEQLDPQGRQIKLYSYNRFRDLVNTRPWTAQGLAELQGGASCLR